MTVFACKENIECGVCGARFSNVFALIDHHQAEHKPRRVGQPLKKRKK